MYSRIAIIILIQLLYSCSSHKNNAEPDKVTFIDSLKWDFYAANFEGVALNVYQPQKNVLIPIQCELGIWKIDSLSIDTIKCYFSPFYESDTNRYWFNNNGFDIAGIGRIISTGNKYPIGGHIWFVFENEDSCKLYFKKNDERFIKYLQDYRGEMSPWLKKEAIRRRVLKK